MLNYNLKTAFSRVDALRKNFFKICTLVKPVMLQKYFNFGSDHDPKNRSYLSKILIYPTLRMC